MGIFSPDQHGRAADENTGPDGNDNQAEWLGVFERSDRQTLKGDAGQGGEGYRQDNGRQKRPLDKNQKKYSQHTAQHHKLTLGKIDDTGRIVDDGETKTDQGVDRTIGKTGQDILDYLAGAIH